MPPSDSSLIAGWDADASRYDALTAGIERRLMAPSRRWVGQRASGEVLEIALGTGANLEHYAPDVQLTAIDWSAGMLEVAAAKASRLGRAVELVRADAASLPFADSSFDTVTATFAMCSIPDLRAALQESLRVLRPGGRLLLADHVAAHWPLRTLQHLVDAITVPLQGEYWTRRPSRELARIGVTIGESERTTFGMIERLSAVRGTCVCARLTQGS